MYDQVNVCVRACAVTMSVRTHDQLNSTITISG